MFRHAIVSLMLTIGLCLIATIKIHAQDRTTSLQNFPGSMPLDAFVDSVSRQLDIRILYDDKLSGKKINIRASGEVPNDSLLAVLQSSLRMSGLALVPADVEGWMRIVDVAQLPGSAPQGEAVDAMSAGGGSTPVTQTFQLEHADPETVMTDIRPFLTQGQGVSSNVVALREQGILIVTDYAANVLRLERLIRLIDQPGDGVETRFIKATHLDAESLAMSLQQLLAARQKASGKGQEGTPGGVEVSFDSRTGQVILIGNRYLVEQAEDYLRTLDVSVNTRTQVYTPINVAVAKVEKLIKGMIEVRGNKPVFRSAVDDEQNLLVVTTTEEIHTELQAILLQLDSGGESENRSRPVRFYRLKHARAEDVLATIQELEGSLKGGRSQVQSPRSTQTGRFALQPDQQPAGISQPSTSLPENVMNRSGQLPLGVTDAVRDLAGVQQSLPSPQELPSLDNAGSTQQLSLTDAIGQARITADIAANTLIVIATPGVHQIYAELIEKLDQPRPQVLIEARMVVVDTSDDFTLGVEVSGGDRSGPERLFAFTSFGFSQVDNVSGALSIIPGVGFNGALVDPDVADAVLRAVSNHRRSKVVSSPRILINDNATGFLTSVTEVPFNSFNTFNTVSSTSFAGYAEAGTTITVTPHISEGEQLQLEYSITLNEFQAEGGGNGSPPPRQTDEIESIVTIPDGHTIIVGGLTRTNHAFTQDSIPFVEQIPILSDIIGTKTNRWSKSTLFVFLRPIILRDDKFRDLMYFSERDTSESRTPGTYPFSSPVLVR
ncbi:MAG: hypothetical protein KDA96_18635 [Planctomycetaceae bacterium]|nr:hypothetical protein [Planctomycetaceae bacterium]